MYAKLKDQPQERFPVWENIVLIRAASEGEAFKKAEKRGREEEGDEDGSFHWGGQPATWVFAGVRKLTACEDAEKRPGDGTEVSFTEMEVASKDAVEQLVEGQAVDVRIADRFREAGACPSGNGEGKAMQFTVGKTYSRREISDALGGSMVSYLPNKDGRIVCGCFKPIPEKNPQAPEKVTIGRVDRNEPHLVSRQAEPIPVFLFRSRGAWEYMGRYRCTGLATDPDLLRREMQANPARGVIAGVLYFERVGD
jgi:hypothetical protein